VVFLVGSWGFGEKYLHIIADPDWMERRDKRVPSSRNAKVVALPQSEKQKIPVRNGAARNAFQACQGVSFGRHFGRHCRHRPHSLIAADIA
jgi:hypothetical protein